MRIMALLLPLALAGCDWFDAASDSADPQPPAPTAQAAVRPDPLRLGPWSKMQLPVGGGRVGGSADTLMVGYRDRSDADLFATWTDALEAQGWTRTADLSTDRQIIHLFTRDGHEIVFSVNDESGLVSVVLQDLGPTI